MPDDVPNSDKPIPYNTPEITHSYDNNRDDLKGIITFYSENIRLPGGYELERLKCFMEEFKNSELIVFAMQQAINANVRSLRYVEKVLYN